MHGTNGEGRIITLGCIEGIRKYDGGEITIDGKIGVQLQLSSLPGGDLGYGRKNSKVIILERILRQDWYLSLFEKVNKNFKDNIFSYYFDITFEETLIRNSQREASK